MTDTLCGQVAGKLCDVCNRCSVCDRKLSATPHVYVCACPEPHDVDLCPECRSKETAYQLTRTREDRDRPHFWSRALSGEERPQSRTDVAVEGDPPWDHRITRDQALRRLDAVLALCDERERGSYPGGIATAAIRRALSGEERPQ